MSPYPERGYVYAYHSGSRSARHLYLDDGDLVRVVKVADGYCKVRVLTGRSAGCTAQVRPGQLCAVEEADLETLTAP